MLDLLTFSLYTSRQLDNQAVFKEIIFCCVITTTLLSKSENKNTKKKSVKEYVNKRMKNVGNNIGESSKERRGKRKISLREHYNLS